MPCFPSRKPSNGRGPNLLLSLIFYFLISSVSLYDPVSRTVTPLSKLVHIVILQYSQKVCSRIPQGYQNPRMLKSLILNGPPYPWVLYLRIQPSAVRFCLRWLNLWTENEGFGSQAELCSSISLSCSSHATLPPPGYPMNRQV